MSGTPWTDEDRRRLAELWPVAARTIDIGLAIGRSDKSVRVQARYMGLPKRADAVSAWTDERVEGLKKLWKDGLSASEVADRLGGVTRNAVLGKLRQLKLSDHGDNPPSIERNLRQKTVYTYAALAAVGRKRDDCLSPPLPGSTPRRWTERDVVGRPLACKWPVDIEGADEQHSCCLPRAPGHKSYCEDHAELALPSHLRKPNKSHDLFEETVDFPLRPTPKAAENQSGGAVLKHQPHPSEIQTMEV
ncbi:MAG: GcrA family cell cycle regulator [Pseudomonadota bacterium]